MNTDQRCPSCQGTISPDSPRGLCPRCCLSQIGLGGAFEPDISGIELGAVIGVGSFGDVHEGIELHAGFRRVAVKILRDAVVGGTVHLRFLEEMQILALLEHPHIARLHGAGRTADQRPYYAMELVEGPRLDVWARTATVPQRLTILRQVAEAVAHAHHQGIVHRDLKPGNILVETTGGTPVAKVIDFGIARALSGPASVARDATLAGQRIGTPLYMSPEQLAGDPRIDTRTDIWALGLLLHELVTGRPLLQGVVSPSASWQDNLRAVQTLAMPRLAERELDWMLRKACAPAPADRYASADAFAADLLAREAGTAVSVGAPYWKYRTWKFLTTHKAAVSIAAALLALLLTLTAGGWWVSARERQSREQISASMTLEQAARARAESAEAALRRESSDAALLAGTRAMELGNLAEARARLAEALTLWPDNKAAGYAATFLRSTVTFPTEIARIPLPWPAARIAADGDGFLLAGPDGEILRLAPDQTLGPAAAFPDQPPRTWQHPDGTLTVRNRPDGVMEFTDPATGGPVMSPLVYGSGRESAAWSPDGRVLASTPGRSAVLWDVSAAGRAYQAISCTPPARWLSFERGSSRLWIIDRDHGMFDWQDGRDPGFKVTAFLFDNSETDVWNLGEGHTRGLNPGLDGMLGLIQFTARSLQFGHPKLTLFIQARETDETLASDSVGRVSHQRPGRLFLPIHGVQGVPLHLAVEAHAALGAAANDLGEIQIFDLETDNVSRTWSVRQAPESLTFTDGAQDLVLAFPDGTVEVYDPATGHRTLGPLALAGEGRTVSRYQVRTVPGRREFLTRLDGDLEIRRYSATTGEMSGPPLRHQAGVHWFCASSDGEFLFSVDQAADGPGTIRVWSLRTGREIVPGLKHPAAVLWATILDNGKRIATSDSAGTVRRWVFKDAPPAGH